MFPTSSNAIARIIDGRRGLRVIGDAHGQADQLRPVLSDAEEKNLGVLFLGDLHDRGPDAPFCMRAALAHEFVPGNHEDKFLRWHRGRRVMVANGLGDTIRQLEADEDGAALADAWAAAVVEKPLWLHAGAYFFVHAGFHPDMLATPPLTLAGKGGLKARALYGQADGSTDADGRVIRHYDWLDEIPEGLTVVIGHDIVSTTEIVVRQGALGGRLVHLDTGAGRDGKLSFLDIPAHDLVGSAT